MDDQTHRRRAGGMALVCAIVLLGASPVCAHDYWFERDGTDYVLRRGHHHTHHGQGHHHADHGGAALVPYEPAIVRQLVCVGPAGSRRELASANEYPARVPGPCAAALARVDTGYWSETSAGTKNQPRRELEGVVRSWRAFESVKRLDAWRDDLAQPLGQGLELVSVTDPFAVRPGRKLRLLVTYEGKPRAGVSVAYDGVSRGVTGADGRINIRVRHDGEQRITASVDEPLESDQADSVVRSTALSFTLPRDD